MFDKITIDYFDPYKGWVELWQCTRCGKLFPLYYLSCPYCDPPKGCASITCEIFDYEQNRNKEEDRQLDC